MKNYLLAFSIFSSIILTGCAAGYVATRPTDVVYVRPVAPGPGYVWIGGEWEWGGGGYHWREGSWQRARKGRSWNPGYWENGSKGYRWQKGNWK